MPATSNFRAEIKPGHQSGGIKYGDGLPGGDGFKPPASAKINSFKSLQEMKSLDWIHTVFLVYSGAHNTINAWHRAENFLFFVFVLVGILSVELMLWTTYKYWKNGRFVGKMIQIGKYASMLAIFYATAGILAQAQAGSANEWLAMYYEWILPSSAPAMFIFAFWIQTADPIMTAQGDAVAYEHMIEVELKRDGLDQQKLELDYKRDMRRLKAHVHRQKMMALMKESVSRRTRLILKKAMQIELPRILKKIGVPVDDIKVSRTSLFARISPTGRYNQNNGNRKLTAKEKKASLA